MKKQSRPRASEPTADAVPLELVQSHIRVIRGVRVMLDSDLAAFYGVPTHRFNEAVKRNAERFPQDDFRFQLTPEEFARLISQSAISNSERSDSKADKPNSSHAAMSSPGSRGGRRKLPWAFTKALCERSAHKTRSIPTLSADLAAPGKVPHAAVVL